VRQRKKSDGWDGKKRKRVRKGVRKSLSKNMTQGVWVLRKELELPHM
jgi:hypothetical protein